MYGLLVSEVCLQLACYDNAIDHCTVHDLLRCMFFTALGTLITNGGELHSDDELGKLVNWLCDDALLFALKPVYI